MVATFVNGSGLNEQYLQRTFHSFGSFGQTASEKIFQKSTSQKQELPVVAMLVNGQGLNEHSLQRTFHRCSLPSVGSFRKAISEEKFLEICQLETRIAMFVNGSGQMCILYKEPSIDASYQVSVHQAMGFQRRRLKCEKLTDDGRKVIGKAHIAFHKVS